MCTKFGADSSIRFPFRARTDRHTDATERPTHSGGYNADIIKTLVTRAWSAESEARAIRVSVKSVMIDIHHAGAVNFFYSVFLQELVRYANYSISSFT